MRSSYLAVSSFAGIIAFSLLASGCGHKERHARGPLPVAGPAQADPQLDALAESQVKAASARRAGAPLNGEVLHGQTYEPGASQEFRVQLDGEHCYWFGGATNAMGEKIILKVLDPHGSKVASEKGKTEALIEYCPTIDGIFKVEGTLAHHGPFSVAVYQGTRITPAAAPTGPVEVTPEQLIAKEAGSIAPGAKQVGNFYEGTADETSWSTTLTKGRCYWFIGAGTPGKTKKLWLYLWDPQNKRVTENRGESSVVNAGHCAKESGMFKFQGKVYSGSGPYKFAVYEKE
jgi:hypothetical protein